MSKYTILDPRASLPPGKYYIGDPCYVLPESEWMDALEATRYFNLFKDDQESEYAPKEHQNGVFARDGVPFAVSGTEYGDGEYPAHGTDYGNSCGVDAGLIGAIPYDLIDEAELLEQYGNHGDTKDKVLIGLGCLHTFHAPFHIHYADGTITFGPVSVDTGD